MEIVVLIVLALVVAAVAIPGIVASGRRRGRRRRTAVHPMPLLPEVGAPSPTDPPVAGSAADRARHGKP